MLTRTALLFVAFGVAYGQIRDAVYEDCGSTAEIISLQVEPCNSDPCVMKRGTAARVYFELVSDQDSETAVLEATTKLFGITVPVPGVETNMCSGVVKCPIKKGKTYKGVLTMPIASFAPTGKTPLNMKLKGDKGVSVCTNSFMILE
ncbi:mite group 2 allergen-like Ixo r 2 isoform X1 [Rhipicephalus sanguineus]|uniref:mite group 2 allergen-like Ixo r 2 isoform X1 n=1 Tax=Rhipicephalus sanguineus TaxID=34632 RepID=UPI00189626E6|nr:mite group 2 allergen-like Ixo r 2 isoform X1 [Rhipicephalus sanguineus]